MKSKSHGCKSSLLPGPRCLAEMEMALGGGDMDVWSPEAYKACAEPLSLSEAAPRTLLPLTLWNIPPVNKTLRTFYQPSSLSLSFPHSSCSTEATPMGEWILVSKQVCEMNTEHLFMCQELRMPPGKKPQSRPSWGLWSCL